MFLWAIVIIISFLPRMYNLGLFEYKLDQIISQYEVTYFFLHPHIILYGLKSSLGTYNFPLFHYLLIIINLFSKNPYYVTVWFAILNSIMICIFYGVFRKFLPFKIALITSVFWALSPWMINYSRVIWAQSLIPIIMIPNLYFLFRILNSKTSISNMWYGLTLTFLVQLHPSGIFWALISFFIILIHRSRFNLKPLLIGIVIGILPALPYFYYEFSSNPICPDCTILLKTANQKHTYDFAIFYRPIQISSGLNFNFLLGYDYQQFTRIFPLIKYINYIFYIDIILFLTGSFIIFFKFQKLRFLLLYAYLIPLLYILTGTKPYMHYYIILYPILPIVSAFAIDFYFRKFFRDRFKVIGLIIFILLVFSRIFFISYFYSYLGHQKYINGEYGTIFVEKEKFVKPQIQDYIVLPEFGIIQSIAYIFSDELSLHKNLANWFAQNNHVDLAIKELKKLSKYSSEKKYAESKISELEKSQ